MFMFMFMFLPRESFMWAQLDAPPDKSDDNDNNNNNNDNTTNNDNIDNNDNNMLKDCLRNPSAKESRGGP